MIQLSEYQPIVIPKKENVFIPSLESNLDLGVVVLPYSKAKEVIKEPAPIAKISKSTKSNEFESVYSPKVNKSGSYNELAKILDSKVKDTNKKNILVKIAEKESSFNPNAKNPKSSASGLFGFIDSTKKAYGYGNTIDAQVDGASKYYDVLEKQVDGWVNQYGNRGKTKVQLMYAAWFRPQSLKNFLANGSDNYKDAQGSSIESIMNKVK